MMLKVDCNDEGIGKTFQVIENGGIVIFPTDTKLVNQVENFCKHIIHLQSLQIILV